jgi:hypothetical protein
MQSSTRAKTGKANSIANKQVAIRARNIVEINFTIRNLSKRE